MSEGIDQPDAPVEREGRAKGDLFAKFITGSMNHSSFDAGTSKPTTKDPSVMPSSTHSGVRLERATAKFGCKNDKGIFHKASIFQIFQHPLDWPLEENHNNLIEI